MTPPVDAALVRRLVADQLPQWAGLPVAPVQPQGNDNRTFRLGDELAVRVPSAAAYAPQVDKEQRWLPVLAPRLPLPVPVPVARGRPGRGLPWEWSVHRWLPGEPVTAPVPAPEALGGALAGFLLALQRVDTAGGPEPGPHCFWRGGPLTTYADEVLVSVEALPGEVPRGAVLQVWDEAVAARWSGEPVWFHGDVAAGNLLVRDGRLAAVIDFGTCGVGDPACDLTVAWTLLPPAGASAFRTALGADAGTWARARGWALWKALVTVTGGPPDRAAEARAVLARVLADPHP